MRDCFLPDFSGCDLGDLRAIRAVERLWREELESVSHCLYYEILMEDAEVELGRLLEERAVGAAYRFRFLGRLLSALGGELSLRTQIRLQERVIAREEGARRTQDILYVLLREDQRICTLYRAAAEGLGEGVARAALCCLWEEKEHENAQIQGFFG